MRSALDLSHFLRETVPFLLPFYGGKTLALIVLSQFSGEDDPRENFQAFASGAKPFRVMAPQLFFLRRNSHQPMTRQILLSWR